MTDHMFTTYQLLLDTPSLFITYHATGCIQLSRLDIARNKYVLKLCFVAAYDKHSVTFQE